MQCFELVVLPQNHITAERKCFGKRIFGLTLVGMLQEKANHFGTQGFFEFCIGKSLHYVWVVFHHSLSATDRAVHQHVCRKLVGAVNREQRRLDKEPPFAYLPNPFFHAYKFLIKLVICVYSSGASVSMKTIACV